MENFVAYRRISNLETLHGKLSLHGNLPGILISKDNPVTRISGVFRLETFSSESYASMSMISFESDETGPDNQPIERGIIDSLSMRNVTIQIRRIRH